MNLSLLAKKYNTQDKCLTHLENVRWAGEPWCPHCDSDRITPRKARQHYFHCNACNKDFTVLYGTIFEGSKMQLTKWFQLISLMLNAKKGISSKQLERTLGITYKSAWYSAMRVRCAMVDEHDLLEGVVEMDEAYIGGKPRHRNTAFKTAVYSKLSTKRGRGTKNIPVVGMVERQGKVRLEIQDKITTKTLLQLLNKYVRMEDDTTIMTDELPAYKAFDKYVKHLSVNHAKKEYTKANPNGKKDEKIHTNTIEGVWSIIKNGIRGEYHVLSRKYLPFYLAEFAYKYNRRNKSGKEQMFDEAIEDSIEEEKQMVDYKPTGNVDEIVYGPKTGEVDLPKPRYKTTKRGNAAVSQSNYRVKRSKTISKLLDSTTPRSKLSAKHKKMLDSGLLKNSKKKKLGIPVERKHVVKKPKRRGSKPGVKRGPYKKGKRKG